jgi:hypothetical protein
MDEWDETRLGFCCMALREVKRFLDKECIVAGTNADTGTWARRE